MRDIAAAWNDTLAVADIYTDRMRIGNVGHEIQSSINEAVIEQGYRVAGPDAGGGSVTANLPEVGVYGHSVGNEPHDIGARIAADLPFAYGDRVRFPLAENEWVAIEFHVSTPIPEWEGKTYYARFENTGQITKDGLRWLLPVQEKLFLIDSGN